MHKFNEGKNSNYSRSAVQLQERNPSASNVKVSSPNSSRSIDRFQIGVFKQLAHYPRNSDGNILDRPRIANYRQMEYSGGRDMGREVMRLGTFVDWPDESSFIKPEDLAKAGFYQDTSQRNPSDRVKCPFCRGVLHSWERGDEPIKEHRRAFSTCPFVLSMDVGNESKPGSGQIPDVCSVNFDPTSFKNKLIGMLSETVCNGGPMIHRCNREFLSSITRNKSFSALSYLSTEKARKLSKNGFYFTGIQNEIECYKCRFKSQITNGQAVNDHRSTIPLCPYLKRIDHLSTDSTSETEEMFSIPPPRLTDSETATRLDSWVVRKTCELGFDPDLTKYIVLQHLTFSGENFLTIQSLIDKTVNLETLMVQRDIDPYRPDALEVWLREIEKDRRKQKLEIEEKNRILSEKIQNNPGVLREYWDDPDLKGKFSQLNKDDQQYQEMINEKLKSAQYCKICMDRPVDVIFIPCYHITACKNCTDSLKECPICRKPIENTIQANMD